MVFIKKTFIDPLLNQRGVIFPWVAGIGLVIIFLTISSVQRYQNQVLFNDTYILSIVRQNLLETAQQNLLIRWNEISPEEDPYYSLTTPNGKAQSTCNRESNESIHCKWEITDYSGNIKSLDTYHKLQQTKN